MSRPTSGCCCYLMSAISCVVLLIFFVLSDLTFPSPFADVLLWGLIKSKVYCKHTNRLKSKRYFSIKRFKSEVKKTRSVQQFSLTGRAVCSNTVNILNTCYTNKMILKFSKSTNLILIYDTIEIKCKIKESNSTDRYGNNSNNRKQTVADDSFFFFFFWKRSLI